MVRAEAGVDSDLLPGSRIEHPEVAGRRRQWKCLG
jgi:hypothetical protein